VVQAGSRTRQPLSRLASTALPSPGARSVRHAGNPKGVEAPDSRHRQGGPWPQPWPVSVRCLRRVSFYLRIACQASAEVQKFLQAVDWKWVFHLSRSFPLRINFD
jgi:hypothetical protein